MAIRAMLFDIDGTLIWTRGAGGAALNAALRSEFGIIESLPPFAISGRTDRGIARDQFLLHGIKDTPENWQRLIAAYVRRLPHFLHKHTGRVLPGIVEILERLSGTDVAVGLLTGNVPDGARIKLTHYRLFHYFAFGSFGDQHVTRDEIAHEAWRIVRQRLGEEIVAEEILIVGDTPLDVQCARAIGARVVAVATGIHSRDELAAANPDVLLPDLADSAPLWQLLDSRGPQE